MECQILTTCSLKEKNICFVGIKYDRKEIIRASVSSSVYRNAKPREITE